MMLSDGVPSSSDSSPPASPSMSNGKAASIVHRVSKLDTLAGIAIKYGVEVSDIKRMNGLVSDLQMFAHEKLHIPLPGRHPPSPLTLESSSSNGQQTPHSSRRHSKVMDSLQSLKLTSSSRAASPAMSILQQYYGLTPPKNGLATEGTELAILQTGGSLNFEDGFLPRASPTSEPSLPMPRSLVDGSFRNDLTNVTTTTADSLDNNEPDMASADKSVRRRQITDVDSPATVDASRRNGKGLALRPKSASRTDLNSLHSNPIIAGYSFMADGFVSVKKSSSTSNLQEAESSSLWPTTKRVIKPDAIPRPNFDGLLKPLISRRNKAALD